MSNKTYILLIIVIFITACNKPDAPNFIKSTGEQTTETRTLSNFSTIDLKGKITLYLIKSTTNKVEITGGKNLLSKIKTDITDSTLTIDNNNTFNWVRSYKKAEIVVNLYFTNINKFYIRGEDKVYSKDSLNVDNLSLEVHSGITDINLIFNSKNLDIVIHDGAGDVKISGKTNKLYTWNNGMALINFRNLQTNSIYFVGKSINKSYINCNGVLDIDLYENGDIYYYGNPTKINERNYSKEAKLIKAD